MDTVTIILAYVEAVNNDNIILLRNRQVIQWLLHDTSFLPIAEKHNKTKDTKEYKKLEDIWGQTLMKARRPDLKFEKQWTGLFGQYVCEELYILLGKIVSKPVRKEHFEPDLEIDDAIIEAKTQTYFTTGTAGEKILGCPFKYAEVPGLYGKPLKIVCMGAAEQLCRTQYGNLFGEKTSKQKKEFLNFFKEKGIEYIGASDLLLILTNHNSL